MRRGEGRAELRRGSNQTPRAYSLPHHLWTTMVWRRVTRPSVALGTGTWSTESPAGFASNPFVAHPQDLGAFPNA